MEAIISEAKSELLRLLDYWRANAPDKENGGFIGRIDGLNKPHLDADKGSVMTARILWTFSSAYSITGSLADLQTATRAFRFLADQFADPEFGGVYWTLDYRGNPKDTHKQIYAQAFAIYGLSEYYRATGNQESLALAIKLVNDVEAYALDPVSGGYREAFNQDWSARNDQRLSTKEINASKTANTHLHLVEAYANLFDASPSSFLKERTENLLDLFREKFIDRRTSHLRLFFTDHWQPMPGLISFGHDIEASWLLLDSARKCGNAQLVAEFKKLALPMLGAALEGLSPDGSLQYEMETKTSNIIREKHWWVQAEAMIGLINAWELSGSSHYLELFKKCWAFTKRHIMDFKSGEWVWGVNEDGTHMKDEDKLGIWKCPYHNCRCCIELVRRLSTDCPSPR